MKRNPYAPFGRIEGKLALKIPSTIAWNVIDDMIVPEPYWKLLDGNSFQTLIAKVVVLHQISLHPIKSFRHFMYYFRFYKK